MAQHKDYGLIGVGNSVQLGKQGPKVVRDGGSLGINITDEDGVTAVTVSGANASQSNHFVTKAQLDSVSADALVADIEYNSGTVTMGTIADGTKTIQTVFSVDTVFDGNTVINIGTDSNNSLLMSAQYYDLTGSGDYVTVNTIELSTTETFKVYVTQGNSTVGNGTVVVSVLDGPVTGSSAGGGSGIALTDLSVTTLDPGGNGSLTYNSSTGVFSFTPADTSSASIGGTDKQVQFNSSGSLAGDSDFTFDGTVLNVGYSGGGGTIRTFGIYSPQSVSGFAIGTHDGTTQRTNQSLASSGNSTATTIHGGLFFAADGAGNRYVTFAGTDIYNLPLANITNVSSTAPTNGQALVWNSSTSEWEPGTVSGGTPGGADHQVQFNDNGSFAGDSDFTFDGSILNVGYSGSVGTIRTFSIYSPQSVAGFAIGTHNGTTQLMHQSLASSGNSTITTIHGALGFAADANGNRYVSFAGTGIYDLPLANITNVSSTTPTNGASLVWDNSSSEWSPSTNVTVDTLTVNDGVKEKLQSKSITGSGTFTFQCANGQVFHVASPAANFGCNFTDLTIDTDYATATTIVIDQGATPYMPTSVAIAGSSATITWQGGSAPSGTANGVDVVTFSFLNVSGTVTVLGQSVSFS